MNHSSSPTARACTGDPFLSLSNSPIVFKLEFTVSGRSATGYQGHSCGSLVRIEAQMLHSPSYAYILVNQSACYLAVPHCHHMPSLLRDLPLPHPGAVPRRKTMIPARHKLQSYKSTASSARVQDDFQEHLLYYPTFRIQKTSSRNICPSCPPQKL